jgi:hypothetical protein
LKNLTVSTNDKSYFSNVSSSFYILIDISGRGGGVEREREKEDVLILPNFAVNTTRWW